MLRLIQIFDRIGCCQPVVLAMMSASLLALIVVLSTLVSAQVLDPSQHAALMSVYDGLGVNS
jgi:hypothetical protein